MDYFQDLNEKALKKIPSFLVVIIITLFILPIILMYFFGQDFFASIHSEKDFISFHFIEASHLQGYFRQDLLEWGAVFFAGVTVILSFIQYRLFHDNVSLLIGLIVLFSGSCDAFHAFMVNKIPISVNKENLDALIWTGSNLASGLLLFLGAFLLLERDPKKAVRGDIVILLVFLLITIAFAFVFYTKKRMGLPDMIREEKIFARPFEVFSLLFYLLFALFLQKPLFKRHPNILTHCLLYMSLTQIVMAIYLLIGSRHVYDSAYNVAYFLKIIFYIIPYFCFMIRYNVIYQTISEARGKLRLSQAKLKHLSAHDTLTKFYNRREFEEIICSVIANSDTDEQSFALIVIDIDNFKSINYSFGHLQGDRFLKAFSTQLGQLTRKEDIISRIDGDEFAVIIPQLSGLSSTQIFAKRLIKGLNNPYFVDGRLLSLTVSMGIAIYPTDGLNAAELLMHAEVAMYTAKRSGKNSYQFYTRELSHLQHRETEIVSHLREALKNDELTLYYQPTYDLVTQEIIGAEVLLRWYNPILGNMLPDEFIPIAENTGLIIDIGEWIFRKMFNQTQQWASKYHKHLLFSVNVSPVQFSNKEFFNVLKKTIDEFNYPTDRLDIEITENLLMANDSEMIKQLKQIDELGIRISLDDFGMGYSSLSRLKSFPISRFKIDRSFVMDIHNEVEPVALIDTLIQLGQGMGMTIIAEGIETEAQLNYLISRQCYIGQGFYLSIPLPADEFEKLAYGRRNQSLN